MHFVYIAVNYLFLIMNIIISMFCFDYEEKNKRIVMISIFLIAIFNAVIYFTPLAIYFINVPVAIFYFVPLGFYHKGHLFQKIFVYVTFSFLTSFAYWFSSLVAELMFGYGSELYYVVYAVVAVVFYAIIFILTRKYGKQLTNKLFTSTPSLIWVVYISLPISSLIAIGYLYLNQGFIWYPKPIRNDLIYILLPFFILASFALLFSSILTTHNLLSTIHDRDFAKNVISAGSGYYQKLNEVYEQIRILRHDYKYHLNGMSQLLSSGNTEELDRYLNKIQIELNKNELSYFSDNPVVNGLVASYAEECKRQNIKFISNIVLPDQFKIDNYELCIVLGNILQNALEATSKLEKDKEIELLVNKTEANQLAIICKNTYNGEIELINQQLSSKKTNGGFGIRSVQAVIQQYAGEFLTEWDETTFSVYILLTS